MSHVQKPKSHFSYLSNMNITVLLRSSEIRPNGFELFTVWTPKISKLTSHSVVSHVDITSVRRIERMSHDR